MAISDCLAIFYVSTVIDLLKCFTFAINNMVLDFANIASCSFESLI